MIRVLMQVTMTAANGVYTVKLYQQEIADLLSLPAQVCVAQRRGSRLTENCKIRKQNALAAPRSGRVGRSHISHTLAASNPAMEFVMIRLILFAWFALAAILLVATDLSEDHHLKQISSAYFAQNDNYQTRHTIRHHS